MLDHEPRRGETHRCHLGADRELVEPAQRTSDVGRPEGSDGSLECSEQIDRGDEEAFLDHREVGIAVPMGDDPRATLVHRTERD